jgi:hypothetical protein
MTMSDLFEQPAPTTLEDLVGPDKKFKTVEDLARAKIEADRFIEQLKGETESMRGEIRARTSLEELAERVAKGANGEMRQPSPQEPRSEKQDEPAPDLTTEVQRLLKEERAKNDRDANIENTRKALKERFGADYNATLRQIAEKLSVSDKFLSDMAAGSPVAFLQLIDSVQPADPTRPLTPPASSIDTNKGAFNQQTKKNAAYYSEIRKKDLNLYYSKKIQNEMHAEALRQGQAFFE